MTQVQLDPDLFRPVPDAAGADLRERLRLVVDDERRAVSAEVLDLAALRTPADLEDALRGARHGPSRDTDAPSYPLRRR